MIKTLIKWRSLLAPINRSLRNDDADANDDATNWIALVSKNNGSARSARAFYILVHFFAVIS